MITDCHSCGRPGSWSPGDNRVSHRGANPCPLPPRDRWHQTPAAWRALQGAISAAVQVRDAREQVGA